MWEGMNKMNARPVITGNLVNSILISSSHFTYHSQFQNGFNIQVGNKLLYIGCNQKGAVPFGIYLKEEDYHQLLANFIWNQSLILYNSKLRVLKIGSNRLELKTAPVFREIIQKNELVVTESMKQALAEYEKKAGLDFKELLSKEQLTKTGQQDVLNQEELREWIQKLLGRGIGLTPSGDDFLLGILAIHQRVPFLPSQFEYVLTTSLHSGYTTAVSVNYLTAALMGSFSESVINVVNQLDTSELKRALANLAKFGHTSGCDTICGMLWALEKISENRG